MFGESWFDCDDWDWLHHQVRVSVIDRSVHSLESTINSPIYRSLGCGICSFCDSILDRKLRDNRERIPLVGCGQESSVFQSLTQSRLYQTFQAFIEIPSRE